MEFAVDIPQGKIALPSRQEIALGRRPLLHSRSPRRTRNRARSPITAASGTPTVLELLDHQPLGYIESVGLKPDFLGGTAEGAFTLSMPLLANLELDQIKIKGAARLNDAIATNLVGSMDISGGALDLNVTEQSVEAKGQISIKGVPAELAWQRIFRVPDERPAADPRDRKSRCVSARTARHEDQPSGAGADAGDAGGRAAWRRGATRDEPASRSHRGATAFRRLSAGPSRPATPQPCGSTS